LQTLQSFLTQVSSLRSQVQELLTRVLAQQDQIKAEQRIAQALTSETKKSKQQKNNINTSNSGLLEDPSLVLRRLLLRSFAMSEMATNTSGWIQSLNDFLLVQEQKQKRELTDLSNSSSPSTVNNFVSEFPLQVWSFFRLLVFAVRLIRSCSFFRVRGRRCWKIRD
jgi:hypothetical protein